MNGPTWRPQLLKLQIYEGIYNLNRAFHATLLSLERLENLGFFRAEDLNACKIELEHTRASANGEFMELLHEHELEEAGRFDLMQKEWEKQLADPDDVFIAARHRKEEIQEQIKELQRGLDLLKPRREKKKPHKKEEQRSQTMMFGRVSCSSPNRRCQGAHGFARPLLPSKPWVPF